MTRSDRRPHALLLFATLALLVYVGNYAIGDAYVSHTQARVPEWVVAFDVFLLVPALYLAILRPPLMICQILDGVAGMSRVRTP